MHWKKFTLFIAAILTWVTHEVPLFRAGVVSHRFNYDPELEGPVKVVSNNGRHTAAIGNLVVRDGEIQTRPLREDGKRVRMEISSRETEQQ